MIKIYTFFFISYIFAYVLTYFGVERFRQLSLKRQIVDVPNERSSHKIPTPRGGGLVFAAVSIGFFLIYCLIFSYVNFWAYIVGAFLICFVSWLDDLYSIPVLWRFAAHSISAFLLIWSFGFWEVIYIPFFGEISFGKYGILLAYFWIVWMVNSYNFMDGIDGIAGVQALTAGVGWFLVGILLDLGLTPFYGGILAVTALAFLKFNWSPARIFMGDVGSAFLGFTFAAMPFFALIETRGSTRNEFILPVVSVFIVFPFVFDSLLTFSKRLWKLERVWLPHRDHIYQKLVIKGQSHQKVAGIYAMLGVLSVVLIILWLNYRLWFWDLSFLIIVLPHIVILMYARLKRG